MYDVIQNSLPEDFDSKENEARLIGFAAKEPERFQVPGSMEFMRYLKELGAKGSEVLVVGDGRAEIQAGVQMGAFVVSRLPEEAVYQRKLHESMGTDLIVVDYYDEKLYNCLADRVED